MRDKKREEIINNMLNIRTNISERLEEQNQEIDNIGYYKDFNFKGSGLAINDAYIVKLKDSEKEKKSDGKPKSLEDEDQKEKMAYEIYDKDGKLVATVNEAGEITFDEEFIEELKQINEKYFNTLELDKAEFELPEELSKDDLVLTGEELAEEHQTKKEIEAISKEIGSDEINSYASIEADATPQFDKISGKQEIDPNAKVTQTETLADMIPEIKQKGIEKVKVVYSDHSKGQNGRFSFVGIDNKGQIQTIDSLESIGGSNGQTVTSINSRDGDEVEEEQVTGLMRIKGRANTNGQEELLSLRVGQYGTIEVDYVRADLSKDKNERYLSAPIETKNQRPTTREVREMMDKSKNTEIKDELDRSEDEIERSGETEIENMDNTASNDDLELDDIIQLEDGTETTLRKEAEKAKISPEEFKRRYDSIGGKTPDEKIDDIQEEIEEEYIGPGRSR